MPETLAGWLEYIERQHTQAIDLSLERPRTVRAALGQQQTCPLITVAGTNGKGSTCAMLESILNSAGYRVGLYTSPHLLDYNERVRIDSQPVSDASLCEAFARIEAARANISLTYFEYATLAAWEVFASQPLDVVILEVGLGGRFDAVNIYDADCAIVTGIDIDHTDFLGTTREQIGFEKAGIFRSGKPCICGDTDAPVSLLAHAASVGAPLSLLGRDFTYHARTGNWDFSLNNQLAYENLPWPCLPGEFQLANACVALAALSTLFAVLPVSEAAVRQGLQTTQLNGRFQRFAGPPEIIVDVAHNAQSARSLANNLATQPAQGATWAVFGMLADKDVVAVISALKPHITHWLPCSLSGPRAASGHDLQGLLSAAGLFVDASFTNPSAAFAYARANASEGDRILAFGSFFTVAEILRDLLPS